ncbi:hypothetical protein [Aurantimonas coralicida]|uniref:hypothetical protein n=1 Tax=Aurantimonas coralicida TaxID=182270 RepID=UPI001D19527C|nr:hypothetical protein [Aurantimonas coralicida]MCC4298329.1 hypothetical protein [Aurantimonas coralicida]
MAKRAAKNQHSFDLTGIEEEFDKIRSLARSTQDGEEQVEDLRCQTLDQMYAFGQQLRTEPEKLEAYFASQNVKMKKVTRKNPYNAFVELAFGDSNYPPPCQRRGSLNRWRHGTR